MALRTRFTTMFGCRHPLQQAGMGGITTPDLALAVASSGALGMLSAKDTPLSELLDAVPVGAVIGGNFLRPGREDFPAVQEAAARMPYVECFWAEPDPELVRIIHAGGALAGWQVGSAREARDAENAGCDLIIAQGVEAGGHVRGTVGLLPLLDEVRAVTKLPIVGAGGIGTGHAMAGALAAGADAVRVGTRFMAATESTAHPAYIDGLLRSGAEDTILTTVFGDGWPDAPHRVLRSAVVAGEALGTKQVWTPDWPSATYTGAAEARALYAGQSVGGVRKRQSAAEIVAELVGEAEIRLTQTVN
jgi:nitronate monooxygenase